MENAGKMLGALLAGAAIGGLLGMLYAPDKGTKTRKKIFDAKDDVIDSITDKFDEFLENVRGEVDKVTGKAHTIAHNGASKAKAGRH